MIKNLFNPANPKMPTAFNSTLSFTDTAKEIEAKDRQAAEQRIAALIETTRETIANE